MIKFVLMSLISMAWIGTANPASTDHFGDTTKMVKDEQQVRIIPVPVVMQSQLSELISPVVKEMAKKMPCPKSFAQIFVTPQLAILVEMHCVDTETEVRNNGHLQLLPPPDSEN